MARAPTTHDPFNAIAEPKRRELLQALGTRELAVNDLVKMVGWSQPMVSKHLAVLKKVGLVIERREGRQHMYHVNATRLKPVYDWVKPFSQIWLRRLEHLDEYLGKLQQGDRDK